MNGLPRTTLSSWATQIADVGYAVVADVFTPAEVETLRNALDAVFEREASIATDRGWLTDAYRVTYMLPAKSRPLLEAVWHPRLLSLARAVLGDDCTLAACNGLTPTPRGRAQPLHQDQPRSGTSFTLQLHAVCVLDPFGEENGATRVVPRSHARLVGSSRGELDDAAIPVVAEVGSVIGFDAALWHGSGANRTSSPRRALHAYYTRPWVVPHWDFPASLPDEISATLTAEQRHLLGYDTRPRRYDVSRDRVGW
jgi:ectoine hydroxylase-related dioxygenase (phytanoyl-CoA dioxygenase family)